MTSTRERVQPTRQTVTESVAEQLTDSPGRSDADSPTPSNPFRGPAHTTKSVKYRYTATGKHLSSPLKGSSSSPERKPDKPKKSKLASLTLTPAPSSHVAKGKAPVVATSPRKRKVSAVYTPREELLNSMFTSSPSPLSSAPTSPVASTKDLPASPTPTTKESIPDLPKRHPVSKARSLRFIGSTASKSSVLSQPLSSKQKQKKNKTSALNGTHAWDIGNSVWVLVDQSGLLADNRTPGGVELSEPLMWWPAQVVQKQPLRVSMFGDFPSSSSTHRGLCTIFAPSSSNIQSVHDDTGAKRFSRSTFRLVSSPPDLDASPPTKKPRLEELASMEARWESAIQGMEKASMLEKDGLPALLSSFTTNRGGLYDSLNDSDPDTSDLVQSLYTSTSKKSKSKESTRTPKPQHSKPNSKDDASRSMPRQSRSPCPPDPTLQIPGELILALAPRAGSFYWPAQILNHVPDVKEKYRVKFLDDKVYVITRDKFWTLEEEGFVRCTLGEWESAIKITDDPDSGDDDGGYGADDANALDLDDSALPPPPPPKDFEDLPVHAQLAYVKPILRAILNKEYTPAREKHQAFMKGGSGRVALLKSAGVRGGMDARFVKAVQKAICKWVLGVSGNRPERLNMGNVTEGGEVEGGTIKATSPTVAPMGTLPRDSLEDDKMEGIEGGVIREDARADKNEGTAKGALLPTTSNRQSEVVQVANTVVDADEQSLAPFPPPANGATWGPVIKQAALAPKSQLDQLLAEVSQAVATEPSLLPSHPEVPKLRVQLPDMARKDMSAQPSPLTPIPDENQPPPPRGNVLVVCEEFENLSGIEKLDYCLNILLPESIQQLLLWRSGERTSSAPLSPEEEQRLHDVGIRKAAETDWVDDVMRLRAAQARLWGIDLNKKAKEEKTEAIQSRTRSQPRRGTVSRP